MRLSTQTDTIMKAYGLDKAVDIFAEAGYDAIDMSFFRESEYGETNMEFFKEIRKKAEDKGLCFNQAHAPFPSSFEDDALTKKRFDEITHSMKIASVLGVENIVVHPCHHLVYGAPGAAEQLFEINMDFYSRLKPYCEEYGIHVAVENMWQNYGDSLKITHSTCSRSAEMIRYVDTLNSEWFVACLDIGHAMLVCEDPAMFIKALGKKRLRALHVHDVDGTNDSHILPYFGIGDWTGIMSALGEIGYEGDLTFESDCFFSRKPEELYPAGAKFMVQTGRALIKIAENAAK